jgi:hypothetical protein
VAQERALIPRRPLAELVRAFEEVWPGVLDDFVRRLADETRR